MITLNELKSNTVDYTIGNVRVIKKTSTNQSDYWFICRANNMNFGMNVFSPEKVLYWIDRKTKENNQRTR